MSNQRFQFESLLVREQIGNIKGWVGMCSPGEVGWRDQILICHPAVVAIETDNFFSTIMEPMGYKNGKWVVRNNPSHCV